MRSTRGRYCGLTPNCHQLWLPSQIFQLQAVTCMFKINFFRWLAIPVCLLAGLLEFLALQRSQWMSRRANFQNPGISR
jgi:hypothetical protein